MTQISADLPSFESQLIRKSGRKLSADFVLLWTTRAAAMTILAMLVALLIVLALSAIPVVREYGLSFIVGSEWRSNELEVPRRIDGKLQFDEDGEQIVDTIKPVFGALPVIYGTFVSAGLALIFAVPVSLAAAVFLTRIATKWLIPPVSFLIELLAAIPSIAYGIWALFALVPLLQKHVEPKLNAFFGAVPGLGFLHSENGVTGRDMFCAGLVLAVMILPIITAVARDVLRAVPRAQIEGSLALGATWWQSCREMLHFSRSGLFGAVMLGLARAAGETMAVAMVIGNSMQIKSSLFAPAQTMSSLLASEFAEASGEMHRSALVGVALVLLLMSLAFNVVARWLVVGKNSRSGAAH